MTTAGGRLDGVSVTVPVGMDAAYYALSLLRRRRLEECIAVSSLHLRALSDPLSGGAAACSSSSSSSEQPKGSVDEQLWFIQTKALVLQNWFDELDVDDDGVDDVLLDGEQTVESSAPRPGTSLRQGPGPTAAAGEGPGPTAGATRAALPQGATPRPLSSRYGYARPGSRASRAGTAMARPITSRLMRVGTASLQAVPGGVHVDVQKMDLQKCAREKPLVARLLCDYLLHVEHRPRLVLELADAALDRSPDWWWTSRMGQACYRLGLLRDAERQFKSALALRRNAGDAMRLAKVFAKMDQPLSAIEVLTDASERHPLDHHVLLSMARLYEQLQDTDKACQLYRRVLQLNSSNVESIACIAAHFFYEKQQPELALRLYRRLLQMGVQTTELWNNLGLSCFYSSQYDIALNCMQRAIAAADTDELLADIWYNIGHIGIATGDLGFAHRAFKIAVGANPRHAEALNNLAVLKLHAGQTDQGQNDLTMALAMDPEQHESMYNAALVAFRAGNFEKAYRYVSQALEVSPDHPKSVALQGTLRSIEQRAMYGGSEEELRASEMAGRVFDNLSTMAPPEMHGIRQVHTSHVGGASLDGENEASYSNHDTSTPSARHLDTPLPAARGGRMYPGVSSLVEIARRESVLRQLYSDKLRGSIHAVFHALVNELPRDHVFLQLLDDPSTHQYCKVRVAEVVESFLFSVQAHQYHNLAAELSKREVEVLTLGAQLEALEQKLRGPAPLRSFKTTQTDNRTDCGMNTADPTAVAAPPLESSAQPDDLIALLEEVTREHELAKCRECLSAPTSLLATVQAEKDYSDKHEYLADVVAHLFRSVHGLVSYAESSLDSLESLRHSLTGGAGPLPAAPGLSLFAEERSRLEFLAQHLNTAQQHCADLIAALAGAARDIQKARDEAIESARRAQQQTDERSGDVREMRRAMKANEEVLLQLRGELQRLLAAESAAAQRALRLEETNGELQRALSQAHSRHFASLAAAARAGVELLAHESRAAKMDLLASYAYEPVAAEVFYSHLRAREAVRHAEAQAVSEATALREREATAQMCYDALRRLLSAMREDERLEEAEQCAEEAESLLPYKAQSTADCGDGLTRARTHASKEEEKEKEAKEKEEEELAAAAVRSAHGISTTLAGVVAGLRATYDTMRCRRRHLRSRTVSLRARADELHADNTSLRARVESLSVETAQQRAELQRLYAERVAWGRQEALRGLLARQEALVAAVNEEREALRARWAALSEDYQSLERRNSQLHERCAAKEVENARLVGFLRTRQQQQQSLLLPSPAASEPLSCASTAREEAAAEKGTPEARAPMHSPGALRSDSSATAGLSAPARTSCSSAAAAAAEDGGAWRAAVMRRE